MATDRATIPTEERVAIQRELQRLVDEESKTDAAIGRAMCISQQAVNVARREGRLGVVFARNFYSAFNVSHNDLVQRHGTPPAVTGNDGIPEASVTLEGSHNLETVLGRFDWPGELSAEQAKEVRRQARKEAFASGGEDLPQKYWYARLETLCREALGRDLKVHQREPGGPLPDPDAPSPELVELKKRRAGTKGKLR